MTNSKVNGYTRCKILNYSTGLEYVESVRSVDEIVEAEGMDESAAIKMENELAKSGRYWITADRCVWLENR